MGQNREDWSGLDAMTSDFDSSLADGRTAREAHEEEVAAVQRVESLVPPARFGALMVECRSAQGQEIADMAARSNGLFTQNYLEKAERGELTLDGGLIGQLAGLYEVDAGPVVPLRSELILDLDRQELKVGDTAMSSTRYMSKMCCRATSHWSTSCVVNSRAAGLSCVTET